MNQSHALENTMVLATVQAFIGSITPSMSAISISVDADKETAELYVALNTADATITTMLEDVVTDISVLTEDAVLVTLHTWGRRRLDDDLARPGSSHGVRRLSALTTAESSRNEKAYDPELRGTEDHRRQRLGEPWTSPPTPDGFSPSGTSTTLIGKGNRR